MRPRRLDHAIDELAGVEDLGPQLERADVELIGQQDVVDDATQALGLVDDERDEALASRLIERRVGAASGGAGERRPQLCEAVATNSAFNLRGDGPPP